MGRGRAGLTHQGRFRDPAAGDILRRAGRGRVVPLPLRHVGPVQAPVPDGFQYPVIRPDPAGALLATLSDANRATAVVSQGCRPIGRHMVITRAEDNIIAELSGQSPLAQMHQVWQELSPRDRRLFRQGLHIGRVINEYQGEFHRGVRRSRGQLAQPHHIGRHHFGSRGALGDTVWARLLNHRGGTHERNPVSGDDATIRNPFP